MKIDQSFLLFRMSTLDQALALLPQPLQEQLSKLDEALGIKYAGALSLVALLLLVLFISVTLLSGSSGGGGGVRRGRPNTILLLGPCGGGKTVLYHQLLHGVTPETVTSMRESQEQGTITRASGAVVNYRLIDFPGHERLRGEWSKHLKEGRLAGVIFVIDAAEFTTATQRATAEFLYEVLTEPEMEEGPAVLIACNKSDIAGAKAPNRVKVLLTAELDKLRKTRGATDAENDDEGGQRLPLGRIGHPLNLDVDAPSELLFTATSCKKINDVQKFVSRSLGVKDSDQP